MHAPALGHVPGAGGYCNNGAHDGVRCLNLNNAASRSNWNIGGSQFLSN